MSMSLTTGRQRFPLFVEVRLCWTGVLTWVGDYLGKNPVVCSISSQANIVVINHA